MEKKNKTLIIFGILLAIVLLLNVSKLNIFKQNFVTIGGLEGSPCYQTSMTCIFESGPGIQYCVNGLWGPCSLCGAYGDENCNGQVDRTELGNYINKWMAGTITRLELGQAIVIWVAG